MNTIFQDEKKTFFYKRFMKYTYALIFTLQLVIFCKALVIM